MLSRDAAPFDRAIDVQVSRLRRKIESAGELIKTVRGAGYLFAADDESLETLDAFQDDAWTYTRTTKDRKGTRIE